MSSPELLLLLTPLKNKISSEKKISREWFSTIFKIKKNIQSFFENEKFSFSGSCAVDFSKKLSSFMLEMEENMDGSEEEKYAFLFCLESLRFISSQVFCKYENEYANSKKILSIT